MKLKRRMLIMGAASVAVCLAYLAFPSGKPSTPAAHESARVTPAEQPKVPDYVKRNQEAVTAFLATVATSRSQTVIDASSAHATEVTLRNMAKTFEFLFRSRRSVTREQDRDRVFDTLLQDPRALDIASRTLAEPGFAEEGFGEAEKQASARHYSVLLLARAAKQGNTGPLRETINTLVTELSVDEVPQKGRQRDLEDLLIHYVKQNSAEVMRDPESFLTSFGYIDNLKRQFVAGLHFGLRDAMDEGAVEALVKRVLVERHR